MAALAAAPLWCSRFQPVVPDANVPLRSWLTPSGRSTAPHAGAGAGQRLAGGGGAPALGVERVLERGARQDAAQRVA